MAEITWRNINSDSSAFNGRALEGAQRSFDSMFDRLASVVNRSQAIEDKNWDTGKVNRTNERLNQLMSYANPEEFAAAQKSGAVQALLQGGQIDEQAIRTAMDARLPQLQQRATQGIQYKNAMIDDATAPLMEQARMLAVNGDHAGAKAALLQAQAAGARNVSQGAEYIDGRQYLGVTRERDATRFKWDGEDQVNQNAAAKDALLTSAVQRDMYRNNMANDNAQRRLAQAKFEYEKSKGDGSSSAAIEKQYQAMRAASPLSMGTFNTKEGKENLIKGLKDLGMSDDARADILHNLNKYYKNGVPVTHDDKGNPVRLGLPVAVILEEAASTSENPISALIPGWSRKGDDLADRIATRFGVRSDGRKGSNFTGRDQELIDQIREIDRLDYERTAGLRREDENKEIRNPSKKGTKKEKVSVSNPFK